MIGKKIFSCLAFFAAFFLISCNGSEQKNESKSLIDENTRIVSLSGTTTEILSALGLEKNIVAVDVTSNYPQSIQALPKVGHNRNISSEAILAQRPTMVVGLRSQVKPELQEQLKSANVKLLLFDLDYSAEGTKKLVTSMADTLGFAAKSADVNTQIDKDLAAAVKPATAPKVLFIYARGTGTMMVSGDNTAAASIINIAGGQNAITGFEEFKPLTPEALVAANPDVILMFDKGLESLGGMEGLLKVPGVAETNAGKNKNVIEMDGQFLTGFGPRLGQAVTELSSKLNGLTKN
jgi:iron complex transport system substrate-binding protein